MDYLPERKTIKNSSVKCKFNKAWVSVQANSEQQQDQSNGFRLWRSEWNKSLLVYIMHYLKVAILINVRDATLADNKYFQHKIANEVGLK